MPEMSVLSNPLATAQQLYSKAANDTLPSELQDSICYFTSRLTQAAGILLRLPQDIAAQAIVILQRYWLVDDALKFEFSDVSAASIYLVAKISASPRSLRSITNVYAYLLSPNSAFSSPGPHHDDPESYYLSESTYIARRNRILNIEGQILNAIGFDTHVALPHALAITYLQTLDAFSSSYPSGTGEAAAKRTIAWLNTALLSPQLVYLTQQPSTLATAAIYLAARDVGMKMPEMEWWEVFDTDREDLGSTVLIIKSLEAWVEREGEVWEGKKILTRADVEDRLAKMGRGTNGEAGGDEEDEMMRLMDEKVAG